MSQSAIVRACRTAVIAGFALLSPVIGTAAWGAEGDVWTLQEISFSTANSGLHPSATVISQHADVRGGFIEFNVDGDNGLHVCPGGTETFRFHWAFTTDVLQITEGADIRVAISGEFLHVDPPCTGHIAAQSRTTAVGTKGGTAGLPEDDLKVIDPDRFYTTRDTIETRFAFASDGEGGNPSTTRYIHLDVYDGPPDRPFAYFMVQFGLFGAGGMQVAYTYKRGSDTPIEPLSLTFEPNYDRPGADYRDFDLPDDSAELCRAACAGEAMCQAFTYVRPGVQGPAPRCWLKSAAPPGYESECCVSGVRP